MAGADYVSLCLDQAREAEGTFGARREPLPAHADVVIVGGGKILASLALETADEYSSLPLTRRWPRRLPPEPFRSVGAPLVRAAMALPPRTAWPFFLNVTPALRPGSAALGAPASGRAGESARWRPGQAPA